MTESLLALPTEEFLAGVAEAVSRFDCASYPQNLPADDWALPVRAGVLLPALPKEYGGRDSHAEMCRVVEILAERTLPSWTPGCSPSSTAPTTCSASSRPSTAWPGPPAGC